MQSWAVREELEQFKGDPFGKVLKSEPPEISPGAGRGAADRIDPNVKTTERVATHRERGRLRA